VQDPLVLLCILVLFAGALFVGTLLSRFFSPAGPSDSGSSGGRGGGSPRIPRGPGPGGVPLDDAQPARIRLRDERRLAPRLPARQRRRAAEPERTPAPVSRTSDVHDRQS
jgi:hypothetical protein